MKSVRSAHVTATRGVLDAMAESSPFEGGANPPVGTGAGYLSSAAGRHSSIPMPYAFQKVRRV